MRITNETVFTPEETALHAPRPDARAFGKQQQAAAGYVCVTLTRSSSETWLPWGINVDESTMRLNRCREGSVAAYSSQARACVGMVLAKMNSTAVFSREEAAAIIKDSPPTSLLLHFQRSSEDRRNDDAGADATQPTAGAVSPRGVDEKKREVRLGLQRTATVQQSPGEKEETLLYHRAEDNLAQLREEEWARHRQHVADKVRENRQGKEMKARPQLQNEAPTTRRRVLITRPAAEACLPWGLLFSDTVFSDKMVLLDLLSAAEKHVELRGCIGMTLETVNGNPVESPEDMSVAIYHPVQAILSDLSGIRSAAFPLDPRPPQSASQECFMSASALQLAMLLRLCTATSISMTPVWTSAWIPNDFAEINLQSETVEGISHSGIVVVCPCRAAHRSLWWG
eukprot:gene17056-biopygen13641